MHHHVFTSKQICGPRSPVFNPDTSLVFQLWWAELIFHSIIVNQKPFFMSRSHTHLCAIDLNAVCHNTLHTYYDRALICDWAEYRMVNNKTWIFLSISVLHKYIKTILKSTIIWRCIIEIPFTIFSTVYSDHIASFRRSVLSHSSQE